MDRYYQLHAASWAAQYIKANLFYPPSRNFLNFLKLNHLGCIDTDILKPTRSPQRGVVRVICMTKTKKKGNVIKTWTLFYWHPCWKRTREFLYITLMTEQVRWICNAQRTQLLNITNIDCQLNCWCWFLLLLSLQYTFFLSKYFLHVTCCSLPILSCTTSYISLPTLQQLPLESAVLSNDKQSFPIRAHL